MAFRVGESGKDIYLITSFDMVSQTSLVIKATPPSGTTKTWVASLGQALTNITLEDGTIVASVPVNQSMKYTLLATTDLDEEGEWTLVGVYTNTNASPDDVFITDPVILEVESANFA